MQPIASEVLAPATLLLPPIILAIENDADRDYLTQVYLDYRNLIYKVALSFFPDDYSEAEDAFSMFVLQGQYMSLSELMNYMQHLVSVN